MQLLYKYSHSEKAFKNVIKYTSNAIPELFTFQV